MITRRKIVDSLYKLTCGISLPAIKALDDKWSLGRMILQVHGMKSVSAQHLLDSPNFFHPNIPAVANPAATGFNYQNSLPIRSGACSLMDCGISSGLRKEAKSMLHLEPLRYILVGSRSYSGAANKNPQKQNALRKIRRASERLNRHRYSHGDSLQSMKSDTLTSSSGQLSVHKASDIANNSALVVTRGVEWGQVMFGFEQANKYTVYDENANVVAHLFEEEGSIGRAIGRQIFRTHRSFTTTIVNPEGDKVLLKMYRPAYLLSSTIYIQDSDGRTFGEVQQRWHPWRRRYDLFINKRQFARIDGGLLAWEFELLDEKGNTVALIDRNFSGFGKEFFTDAGKYVVHFGEKPVLAAKHLQNAIHAAHPNERIPPITSLTKIRTNADVIPTSEGDQLVVARSLEISERLVALAAAISIDYDFFSRHSYGSGILSPFIHPPIIPLPIPTASESGVDEVNAFPEDEANMGIQNSDSEHNESGPNAEERSNSYDEILGNDDFHADESEKSEEWGWDWDQENNGDDASGSIMDVFGWGDED